VKVERGRERGENELVRAERSGEGVPRRLADEVGPAEEDSRLRPAEELVGGEADQVGAVIERARGDRLVGEARVSEARGDAAPAS
jgi:hypothetical protein